MGAEIFHTLRGILIGKGLNTGIGDEGGFAPELNSNEEAANLVLEAVEKAGFELGTQVSLGLDVASSEFYEQGRYKLVGDGCDYGTEEFIEFMSGWIDRFPIITIEDPLAETDWSGWEAITRRHSYDLQLTGDDLFVTNPEVLLRGIARGAGNSILIKLNQIGSLSETLEAIRIAQENNYGVTISHRSGETEDTTIADLAVATGAGQIKTGSLCRSERVAKYNRLMLIEMMLGCTARYAGPSGFPHTAQNS
jgi:enolase